MHSEGTTVWREFDTGLVRLRSGLWVNRHFHTWLSGRQVGWVDCRAGTVSLQLALRNDN